MTATICESTTGTCQLIFCNREDEPTQMEVSLEPKRTGYTLFVHHKRNASRQKEWAICVLLPAVAPIIGQWAYSLQIPSGAVVIFVRRFMDESAKDAIRSQLERLQMQLQDRAWILNH